MKEMPAYFIPFAFLLVASFLYKASLDPKIRAPKDSKSIFSILVFRKFGLETLLPWRPGVGDEKEKRLRKKANIALIIFYGSFITINVLSKFVN
jgi:hypothetical protein